ncbi:hypothetical protein D3C75_1057320 [compost metagenome]
MCGHDNPDIALSILLHRFEQDRHIRYFSPWHVNSEPGLYHVLDSQCHFVFFIMFVNGIIDRFPAVFLLSDPLEKGAQMKTEGIDETFAEFPVKLPLD